MKLIHSLIAGATALGMMATAASAADWKPRKPVEFVIMVTTQLPQPDAFIDGPSDGSEIEDELIRRGFQGFQDVPTLFSRRFNDRS